MRTRLLRMLYLGAIAVGAMLGALMFLEEGLIFFPERGGVGPSPGQDVWLTTADEQRIHGWYLTRPDARAALLHLHGNAGNLESRRELVIALAELGVDVLAIDYRGYGKSSGRPSERGLYDDALAAHAFLRARRPALPIVVHGESLGAGPACELALRTQVDALVLQSAFTSIPDMAAEVYPLLPVRWLIRTRFDNLSKVPRIGAPKLIIHSRRDEIVPFAMGERLFAAAQAPKQKLWLARAGHNDALWSESDALLSTLRRFVEQVAATR